MLSRASSAYTIYSFLGDAEYTVGGSIRMKARVVTKIEIAAKPAEVFKYLAKLRYHHLWNPHLQDDLPDMTLGLGKEYRTESLLFAVKMHSKNIVTAFTQNKLLELSNNTGMLEYRVRYRLESKAGITVLICSTTVSSESRSFAFAKPILKLLAQRELHIDLQLLKTAVEQQLE